MHGWAIAQRIQQISDDLLRVQQGSLYPALHRLEHQGWIDGRMGRVGEQSPGPLLLADQGRPQAARGRGRRNGSACRPASTSCCRGPNHAVLASPRSRLRSLVLPRRPRSGSARGAAAAISNAKPSGSQPAASRRRGAPPRRGACSAASSRSRSSAATLRGTRASTSLVRDVRTPCRRLLRDWRFTRRGGPDSRPRHRRQHRDLQPRRTPCCSGRAVSHPDRLVDIYQNGSNRPALDANSLRRLPGHRGTRRSLRRDDGGARAGADRATSTTAPCGAALVEHVTASYLSVLGLQPALGRWFDATEDVPGAPSSPCSATEPGARMFGADPAVIGRTLRLKACPSRSSASAPAGPRGTLDVGLGHRLLAAGHGASSPSASATCSSASPTSRALLGQGAAAGRRDRRAGPGGDGRPRPPARRRAPDGGSAPAVASGIGRAVDATSASTPRPTACHRGRDASSGLVGLVLAIACSNLATLLLVRGTARAKESRCAWPSAPAAAQLVRQLLDREPAARAARRRRRLPAGLVGVPRLQAVELPITVDLQPRLRASWRLRLALSTVTGSPSAWRRR